MIRRSSRRLVVPFLILVLAALAATGADAWPTACDNCYKGFNRMGEIDAQCCLDGRCDIWENEGYHRIMSDMEWCTSWMADKQAGCNGEEHTCSYDGDGGGGEDAECTITVGEYCPPECSHCFLVF